MKKDSPYIINFDDKSFSVRQYSIYRVGFNKSLPKKKYIPISSLNIQYWRRLHRQQRVLIIAFILLFIFIYIGFHLHSNKLVKQISSENHRDIINKDKNLWQLKQIQVSLNILRLKVFYFNTNVLSDKFFDNYISRLEKSINKSPS
jgi:hypothetical protein